MYVSNSELFASPLSYSTNDWASTVGWTQCVQSEFLMLSQTWSSLIFLIQVNLPSYSGLRPRRHSWFFSIPHLPPPVFDEVLIFLLPCPPTFFLPPIKLECSIKSPIQIISLSCMALKYNPKSLPPRPCVPWPFCASLASSFAPSTCPVLKPLDPLSDVWMPQAHSHFSRIAVTIQPTALSSRRPRPVPDGACPSLHSGLFRMPFLMT